MTKYLGWNSKIASTWQRVKDENHELWEKAPDIVRYFINNENVFKFQDIESFEKSTISPSGLRGSMTHYVKQYYNYKDLMTEDQRDRFKNVLKSWANLALEVWADVSRGGGLDDSDQLIANYFGVYMWALAVKDEEPQYSDSLLMHDRMKSWGEIIEDYFVYRTEGTWLESSEYNLTMTGTLKSVYEINDFVGENLFPEITSKIKKIAEAFKAEITPDFREMFHWGDVQRDHLHSYYRADLFATLAFLTDDSDLWYYHQMMIENNTATGKVVVSEYWNPFAELPDVAPEPHNWHDSKRGIAIFKNKDLLFGCTAWNPSGADHGMAANNFALYKDGKWLIDFPIGYYVGKDVNFTNNMIAFGGLSFMGEFAGEIDFKAGEDYMYQAFSTSGVPRPDFYFSPSECIHELTRRVIFKRFKNSEVIIIQDRIDTTDPRTLDAYDRHSKWQKEYMELSDFRHAFRLSIPNSPLAKNGDTWSWQNHGVNIKMHTFAGDYDYQIIDELEEYRNPNLLKLEATFSRDEENRLKHQLRIKPKQIDGFQTMLNVIVIGDELEVIKTGDKLQVGNFQVVLPEAQGERPTPSERGRGKDGAFFFKDEERKAKIKEKAGEVVFSWKNDPVEPEPTPEPPKWRWLKFLEFILDWIAKRKK